MPPYATFGRLYAPPFHQVRISRVEVVCNIWLDMVHTLKGQWDGCVGGSDTKIAQGF